MKKRKGFATEKDILQAINMLDSAEQKLDGTMFYHRGELYRIVKEAKK